MFLLIFTASNNYSYAWIFNILLIIESYETEYNQKLL